MEVADRNAILAAPALKPPSGTISDFAKPYSTKNIFIPASAVCVFFSTVFVIIRIWTKVVMKKVMGWDDSYCAVGAASIPYGSGVHQWNVPRAHYIEFLKFVYTEELLYCIAIIPTKTSILLQQIHVFIPNRNKTYFLTHALIWLNAVQYIIIFFLFTFLCTPIRRIWEGDLIAGKCLDHKALIVSGSGLNVLSGFAILVLPISSVWRLKLARTKKLRISAVFAMGLFACVSSIMRFIAGVKLMKTEDLTFALVDLYLWTVAELSSAIICGCFPTVPQLVHYVSNLSRLRPRTSKSQSGVSVLLPGRTPRPPMIRKGSTFYCAGLVNLMPGMAASKTSHDKSTVRTSAPSAETFVASIDAVRRGNDDETNQQIYERDDGSLASRHGSREEAGLPIDGSSRGPGELEKGTAGAES
ncbi:MAG: hypothetical protein Q9224_001774 [Gallowayella concinna]